MNIKEALIIIGGFSTPSKMPWYAWSISAKDCIVGSRLREIPGSTCSTCYALKGNYVFPNVVAAHRRRRAALEDPRFVDAFVFALTFYHAGGRRTYEKDGETVKENRFRWFDSGDLPDIETLEKINTIAERTPQIDHWLPTRELGFVGAFLRQQQKAPNLLIRISTPMIGDRFRGQPLGLPFSTVDRVDGGYQRLPGRKPGQQVPLVQHMLDGGERVLPRALTGGAPRSIVGCLREGGRDTDAMSDGATHLVYASCIGLPAGRDGRTAERRHSHQPIPDGAVTRTAHQHLRQSHRGCGAGTPNSVFSYRNLAVPQRRKSVAEDEGASRVVRHGPYILGFQNGALLGIFLEGDDLQVQTQRNLPCAPAWFVAFQDRLIGPFLHYDECVELIGGGGRC